MLQISKKKNIKNHVVSSHLIYIGILNEHEHPNRSFQAFHSNLSGLKNLPSSPTHPEALRLASFTGDQRPQPYTDANGFALI